MAPFTVCIHDATPAYARETVAIVRDLEPLVGRRLSLGVVPDWHGQWPLRAHRDYCALVKDVSEEQLLHGYFHRRSRGWGLASALTKGCDEMNGLDGEATRHTLDRGQRVFEDVFGTPARGFLAPGWQRGHVRAGGGEGTVAHQMEYIVGYFSVESWRGRRVPLATWSWDCGRWGWLGHAGHALGQALHSLHGRIPCLAIHPRDLARGFWPAILRLTEELLDHGYEPVTVGGLVDRAC